MHLPDAINATFELSGACSAWANVKRLRIDRDVKGTVWQYMIVWWLWGLWNVVYYGPILGQWLSECAGWVLVAGNLVWLITWIRIMRERASLHGLKR